MRRFVAGLAVTAVLVASGCGTTPGRELVDDPEVERPAPVTTHIDELVSGINDAGYRLYHAAPGGTREDVALSPLSIAMAFGMLDVGATDTLAEQLEDLFGWPAAAGEQRWHAFNALEQSLTAEREIWDDQKDPVTLTLANRLFTDPSFNPEPDFVEALPRFFGAYQEELDMRNDPEGARRYVNAWVASRTDDLIKELLGEGAFNDRSQLALVNALYFKAAWATPFKDSFTEDADFTLLDGSTVTVDMMHAPQFAGRATQGSDYVAIDLPYANANMSMTVIVPDEGAFREVQSRIGAEFTAEVDAEISAGMVSLWMPRFETGARLNLQDVIVDGLGYDSIFHTAQLQGIGPESAVSAAFHEAKVIVDEEGTEAAAATAIVVETLSAPPPPELNIRIDRPFIYLIRDHDTGVVLFVGHVLNPASS